MQVQDGDGVPVNSHPGITFRLVGGGPTLPDQASIPAGESYLALSLEGARDGAQSELWFSNPTLGSAQNKLELTPYFGSYIPLADFGTANVDLTGGGTFVDVDFRQQIGILGGLRLRLNVGETVGIELAGSYINSGWKQSLEAAETDIGLSVSGYTLTAEGRFIYRPRRKNVFGILGVAYQSRGGDAWDTSKTGVSGELNTNNFAAIVGIGVRAAASPGLSFDVTIESQLYSANRVESGFVLGTFTNAGFQADLLITIGIPIALIKQ